MNAGKQLIRYIGSTVSANVSLLEEVLCEKRSNKKLKPKYYKSDYETSSLGWRWTALVRREIWSSQLNFCDSHVKQAQSGGWKYCHVVQSTEMLCQRNSCDSYGARGGSGSRQTCNATFKIVLCFHIRCLLTSDGTLLRNNRRLIGRLRQVTAGY